MIELGKAHSNAAAITLSPFIRASSPNLIQVDAGQSGLTPPAGFTWLETE